MPRRLGGVQQEGNPTLTADFPNCGCVLYATAYVGAVGYYYQPRVGAEQRQKVCRVQIPLPIAGNAVKGYPLVCQAVQRAHDGVVLHAAGNAVVSGLQPAPERHIQPHRVAAGQNAVGGVAVVEQLAQPFPQQQRSHARVLCAGINAAIDGRSHLCQIACHGSGYGRGLRKRSGGVI